VSLFAGVYAHRPGPHASTLVSEVGDALALNLSRWPDDRPRVYRHEFAYIAAVDIGATEQPTFRSDPNGTITVAGGQPIWDCISAPRGSSELDTMHEAFLQDDWDILEQTNGVFNAVHFHPARRTLTLVTDKLGIRPLYVWEGEDIVVFATALRILESVPQVVKTMDLRGVCELTAFGYPLADRTPYVGIRRLLPAERLSVSREGIRSTRYWQWDAIRVECRSEQDHLALLHERFMTALERRLGGDRAVASFLSGGLDSRTMVGGLRAMDVEVYTFNFSHPGSQDQAFAAWFAEAARTTHHETARQPDDQTDWSAMMASALERSPHRATWPIERPRMAWSGDGGGVVGGHMTREIIDAMRSGDIDAAIRAYIRKKSIGVKPRILQRDFAAAMMDTPMTGVRKELDSVACEDPARSFFLYFLFNQERRHLDRHFERLDLHRIEFHLPYLDSAFVAAILTVPVDLCLRHVLYHRWLHLFPAPVAAVPWQTYPGHEPCPLPIPSDLDYQWNLKVPPSFQRQRRQERLRDAANLLWARDFPRPILNRSMLRKVFWAYKLRLRDTGYLLETASRYYKYWRIAEGRYGDLRHSGRTAMT
jgi:asparagine synthase (glutamine-hydrolysing)